MLWLIDAATFVAVADELGGKFSQLRDASGESRFEAKDLVFGRPEQVAPCKGSQPLGCALLP